MTLWPMARLLDELDETLAFAEQLQVCHYTIQPLVELYGDCMVVLKVS